jgi:hypothetical protein
MMKLGEESTDQELAVMIEFHTVRYESLHLFEAAQQHLVAIAMPVLYQLG